nr:reverse transcriptase domain-containing protein [Tanacetum cinerariifolium]
MATLTDMMSKFVSANTASSSRSGTLPSNTITNPKEELKGITTRSGVAYQGPKTPSSSKQGTKVTKDQVQTPSSQNTAPVQPSVIQSKSQVLVSEPVVAPVSAPMPNLKPSIPYPSRRDNENAEKLSEMARITINEHCSAVILNKLPRKLGDPSKFLIPCEFPGMSECLALADLGASINLMPLSVWEGISLPDLTPTCMTLELADHSVSKPIGIAKDVSFKVRVFHFPVDFVVVDFEPDPRVPLILGKCFLKTSQALIDVHKGELTLCIENEAITYNLDQTVLGFSNVTASSTPTPHTDPIVFATSPTLTPFGDSDFLLFEEADAFLEVELKNLPHHLEYAFLEGDNKLPVIIAKELGDEEKSTLKKVLKSHKRAIAWKLSDIQGINLEFCTHKILMEEDYKPTVQHQRRSMGQPGTLCTQKGGFTVVENEEKELIPTCLVTGWRVRIDYRKLNEATRKDHFPLPFMDQMLERLAGNEYYCFLDGFSGYFQIPIDPRDQENTTFTCPYGTFAYRRMPFGLCNAPGTFQRCMLAIFYNMVEKTMEVFMDDFSVFGNSFENCLSRLDKMLQRCEDKAKIDVIAKLPHPTIIKGVRSFLGYAGFYRRFIRDFSKISRLMTHLLEKNTSFVFSEDCIQAFQTLKKKLTEAP